MKKPCYPSRRESGYLSPGPTSNFLEHLKSDLVRENARYQYVYAVALNSHQQSSQALQVVKQARKAHPFDGSLQQLEQSLLGLKR